MSLNVKDPNTAFESKRKASQLARLNLDTIPTLPPAIESISA